MRDAYSLVHPLVADNRGIHSYAATTRPLMATGCIVIREAPNYFSLQPASIYTMRNFIQDRLYLFLGRLLKEGLRIILENLEEIEGVQGKEEII